MKIVILDENQASQEYETGSQDIEEIFRIAGDLSDEGLEKIRKTVENIDATESIKNVDTE